MLKPRWQTADVKILNVCFIKSCNFHQRVVPKSLSDSINLCYRYNFVPMITIIRCFSRVYCRCSRITMLWGGRFQKHFEFLNNNHKLHTNHPSVASQKQNPPPYIILYWPSLLSAEWLNNNHMIWAILKMTNTCLFHCCIDLYV